MGRMLRIRAEDISHKLRFCIGCLGNFRIYKSTLLPNLLDMNVSDKSCPIIPWFRRAKALPHDKEVH